VQEDVLRRLAPAQRPTAWKVSPPPPGKEPLASPVPRAGIHDSPARLARDARTILGVEAEIAFRFLAAPDAARESIANLSVITEALVLIELCATRLENCAAAPPLCRLADFQSHAAFVFGSGVSGWRAIDFSRQEVTLRVNGRVAAQARGSHPTGDLAGMLAWAVGHCARRGMPLATGDVVTMGSWTGMTALAPGGEAIATFEGIGEACLTLER
jgi:2-keto-4-pentenoate hydratase